MDKEFLDILVCPKCHGKLEYNDDEQTLTCWECRLEYGIDDGIPVMLIEEARPINEAS